MRSSRTLSSLLACGAAAGALMAAGQAAALPVPAGTPALVNPGGAQPAITFGSSDVSVNLNAQRTIIDWDSFDVLAGQSAQFLFDQRNWIVLNRVANSPVNIDGQIVANFGTAASASNPVGGNVWFYSPQGVAFGPNARVDVGGLLATSALANTAAFLNPANVNIPFTGSGSGGPVTVASGAQLNATAHIALVAPLVTTAAGSTATVSDYGTALYGGADTYEIQFFPTFNNDLTLFTFIVPNSAAGTPNAQALSIAGQTTSGTIYLAAYSRAALASELINAPGLLTAQSSFNEYGQVTITTGRNIILGQPGANGQLQFQVPGVTSGSVRVGEINADGNVNVILTPIDVGATGVLLGDFNATKVRSGQGLVIVGNVVNIPGGVSSGDAGVNFRNTVVNASGPVNIPTITSGTDIFVGSRFNDFQFDTVTAGGGITLMTLQGVFGNQVTSGGGTLLVNTGGPTSVSSISGAIVQILSAQAATVGSVTGATSVTAGSNTSLDFGTVTAPTFTATSLMVSLGTVSISGDALIRTPQMNLTTSFTAANLTIEGSAGRFRLGGAIEPGLTDAELQRIRVTGALNLYAGQTVPTPGNPNPAYGDFEVHDLTLDVTKVPRLNLFARTGRQVSVLGSVQVIGSGGILQIGEAASDALFKPSRILISGSLGTAQGDALAGFTEASGFAGVQLNAGDDILIGSSRFIELIDETSSSDIDLAGGLPSGVAAEGDEIGHLFLVAGRAELSAGGRILQQNTAAVGGPEAGIYLTGEGIPASESLLVIGGGPEAVDLFGSLADETGLISGSQAAFSRRITAGSETAFSSAARFNGCPLGIGCAVATPSTAFRIESFQPAAAAAAIDPPVLTAPPRVDDDEDDDEAVVTGTGNEEIWRRDQ